jgi:hypothetical protein
MPVSVDTPSDILPGVNVEFRSLSPSPDRSRSPRGHSFAGTVGLNPAGCMDLCLLRVLSSSRLCDGPIPRLEESYRVVCMCVCH